MMSQLPYRHPLLITNTNVHPVMLGPVIIHSHKTYDSYYTLPSNIIRFKPQLKNIFVVGTDDELNLHIALLDYFQATINLLCTIHIVDAGMRPPWNQSRFLYPRNYCNKIWINSNQRTY